MVVKGEPWRPGRRPPPRVSRIAVCFQIVPAGLDYCAVSNTDGVTSGISSWIAERSYLFELYAGETSLFVKLACGRAFQSLALFHEASRQRPKSAKRFAGALDEEHLNAAGLEAEQNNIHGHGRPLMVIAILICA
jgi:hypothetical protein